MSKVAAVIHEMGWWAATLGAVLFLARALRLWWWDRSHGVTTRHRVALSRLGKSHVQFYEGSDTKCLPRIPRRSNVDFGGYVFTDAGAGKGTPMLLAAEFPFRRIVALQASEALAAVCAGTASPF